MGLGGGIRLLSRLKGNALGRTLLGLVERIRRPVTASEGKCERQRRVYGTVTAVVLRGAAGVLCGGDGLVPVHKP